MPVPVLREALKQRVAESSLRVAAEEVGLSWKGVDKIIAGSEPQAATVKKLTEWFLRRAAARQEEPTLETVAAAFAVLVRHFPPAQRAEAVERVTEALRDLGELKGTSDPTWMSTPVR